MPQRVFKEVEDIHQVAVPKFYFGRFLASLNYTTTSQIIHYACADVGPAPCASTFCLKTKC